VMNFSDCTLALLEKTLGLEQVKHLSALDEWLHGQVELSAFVG